MGNIYRLYNWIMCFLNYLENSYLLYFYKGIDMVELGFWVEDKEESINGIKMELDGKSIWVLVLKEV